MIKQTQLTGKFKKSRKFAKGYMIICIVLLFMLAGCRSNENLEVNQDTALIVHALGGIDDKTHLNSKEGFEYVLSKGYTLFEADFRFTSDDILVLRHSWEDTLGQDNLTGEAPAFEEFISTKMYGKYTPLSFEDLLYLMNDNEEIYIVTDTKYTGEKKVRKEFLYILEKTRELGMEEVLDRFIIQIYNEEMLSVIREIYPFREYIFTLYKLYKKEGDQLDLNEIAEFCSENDIKTVTVPKARVNSGLIDIMDKHGIAVYTHTVNSMKEYKKFTELGVKGFYSDFLEPGDID